MWRKRINTANERWMEFNGRVQWHIDRQTRNNNTGAPKMQSSNHYTSNVCWSEHAVDQIFVHATLWLSVEKDSTWSTVKMSPAQQLLCAEHGQRECFHYPCCLFYSCVCMHICACIKYIHVTVYKLVFLLIQSKTQHVWPRLEVTSGAKLNKRGVSAFARRKNTWQHSGVQRIYWRKATFLNVHALLLAPCRNCTN